MIGKFILCKMLLLLLSTMIFSTACSQPERQKTTEAGKEKSKDIHEHFRSLILEKKGQASYFEDYCELLPMDIEKRGLKLQSEIQKETEASKLLDMRKGLLELGKELDDTEHFLKTNCLCDEEKFSIAYTDFGDRAGENRNLIAYILRSVEYKVNEAKKKAEKEFRIGLQDYLNHLPEDAYGHFAVSIRHNENHAQSQKHFKFLQSYFSATELVAERRLDEANAKLIELKKNKVLPIKVNEQLSKVAQNKRRESLALRRADSLIKRGRFDMARNELKRAQAINYNSSAMINQRIEALAMADLAFKEKKGDREKSIASFKKAHELWPEQKIIKKWYKTATRDKRMNEARLIVSQASKLMAEGSISEAEIKFEQAIALSDRARSISKSISKTRKAAGKQFGKQAGKLKKEKRLFASWQAYDRCYRAAKDRKCKTKRDRMAKTLTKQVDVMEKNANCWEQLFVALHAKAAILPKDEQAAENARQARLDADRRSTLVLHRAYFAGTDAQDTMKPVIESISLALDKEGLRWRMASGEDGPEDGIPLVLRLGKTPKPAKALEGTEPVFATVENGEAVSGEIEQVEMGMLVGLYTIDDELLWWTWSKDSIKPDATASLIEKTMAWLSKLDCSKKDSDRIRYGRLRPGKIKDGDWIPFADKYASN